MADIQALKSNHLLRARIEGGDSAHSRLEWLRKQFSAAFQDKAEVTSISLDGKATNFAVRGATPDENLTALRLAIEEVEAEISGDSRGYGSFFTVGISMPTLNPN